VRGTLPHVVVDTFKSMLESLGDPQQRHAMMVHLPIAIAMLSAAGLLLFAIGRGRRTWLRRCCIVLYLLGGVLGLLTEKSGEAALDNLDVSTMTAAALERIEAHESMGEQAWLYFLATAALTAMTAVRFKRRDLRTTALVLAALSGLVTAGYISAIAHHGGALVYVHGVGVPTSENNLTPKIAPPAHEAD
jgi:uncharacterized membrane protein